MISRASVLFRWSSSRKPQRALPFPAIAKRLCGRGCRLAQPGTSLTLLSSGRDELGSGPAGADRSFEISSLSVDARRHDGAPALTRQTQRATTCPLSILAGETEAGACNASVE